MRVFRYARTADECPARPPDARSVDGAGRVKLRWRVADGWVDTLEHRWLLGYPDGDVVHLNGDPADNRPSNLEVRRR